MKFPTKLLNIFHHTLSMFLHYLGKVNSSNILQITTDKIKKCLVFDKNEMFMLSYGCIEIGILFSTAYARSARRLPAQRRYSTTRQLHCQWQWLTLYIYAGATLMTVTYIAHCPWHAHGIARVTRLDWIEQCFTSPPTQYRLYGRRFLQDIEH